MDYSVILDHIENKKECLFAVSDTVWEAAETAFSEHKSSKALADLLKSEGFTVTMPAYDIDTAFTASFGKGRPIIGLLGEYDALGNLSQKADVFKKEMQKPGANGHGCGHNLLGAASLGAALGIKEYLKKTGHSGTVIYFGCPGEEGGSSKAFMAREGAFDALDCALTWHPGMYNVVYTESSLANIQVHYKFTGISAHAAGCPELGRSALDAVELMNVGVNFLREHMVQEARIHYAITDTGGISPNVVQPSASVLYLIRAPKAGQAQELYERVNKIARGAALMTETDVTIDLIKTCANLVPNTVLERLLYESMTKTPLPAYTAEEYAYAQRFTQSVEGEHGRALESQAEKLMNTQNKEFVRSMKQEKLYNFVMPYENEHQIKVMSGSTDVGDASWKCPTAQFYGCTWAPDTPGHSWQIVAQGKGSIAKKGLLYAAKVLATTAIDLYERPDILGQAMEEYKVRTQHETYYPIPKEVKPRPISEFGT